MSFLRRTLSATTSFVNSTFRYSLGECLTSISMKANGRSPFLSQNRQHSSGFHNRWSSASTYFVTPHDVLWNLSWEERHKSLDGEMRDTIYESLIYDCDKSRLDSSLAELGLEGHGLFCNTFCKGPFMAERTNGVFKLTSDMDGNFCTAQEFHIFKESVISKVKNLASEGCFGDNTDIAQIRAMSTKELVEKVSSSAETIARVTGDLATIVSVFIPGVSIVNAVGDAIDLVKVLIDLPISMKGSPSPNGPKVLESISAKTTERLRNLPINEYRLPTSGSSMFNEQGERITDTCDTVTLGDYLNRRQNSEPVISGDCFTIDICETRVKLQILKRILGRSKIIVYAKNSSRPYRKIYSRESVSHNRIFRIIAYLIICKLHKTMGITEGVINRSPMKSREARDRVVSSDKKEPHNLGDMVIDDFMFERFKYEVGEGLTNVPPKPEIRAAKNAHLLSLHDSIERLSSSKTEKFIAFDSSVSGYDIYYYGLIDKLSFYFPGLEDVAIRIYNKLGVTDEDSIIGSLKGKTFTVPKYQSRWGRQRFETDINYLLLCCGRPKMSPMNNKIPVSLYVMRAIECKGKCVNPMGTDLALSPKFKSLVPFPKSYEEKRKIMPLTSSISKEKIVEEIKAHINDRIAKCEEPTEEEKVQFKKELKVVRSMELLYNAFDMLVAKINRGFDKELCFRGKSFKKLERVIQIRKIGEFYKDEIKDKWKLIRNDDLFQKFKNWWARRNIELSFNCVNRPRDNPSDDVNGGFIARTIKSIIKSIHFFSQRFDILTVATPLIKQMESYILRKSLSPSYLQSEKIHYPELDPPPMIKEEIMIEEFVNLSYKFCTNDKFCKDFEEKEKAPVKATRQNIASYKDDEIPVERLVELANDLSMFTLRDYGQVQTEGRKEKKIRMEKMGVYRSTADVREFNKKYRFNNLEEIDRIYPLAINSINKSSKPFKPVKFMNFISIDYAYAFRRIEPPQSESPMETERNKRKMEEEEENERIGYMRGLSKSDVMRLEVLIRRIKQQINANLNDAGQGKFIYRSD